MTIYKKKLFKEPLTYIYGVIPLIFDISILTYSYVLNFANLTVTIICILALNLPLLLTFFQFNYVIIQKNELVVGNGVYTFLKRRYCSDQIVKILIGQGKRYYAPYIQIFTQQKKSRKFMLILVLKPDLQKIVSHLEELNISVEFDLNK